MIIFTRPVQLLKEKAPIYLTLSGIVTLTRFSQSENAPSLIFVTPTGITASVTPFCGSQCSRTPSLIINSLEIPPCALRMFGYLLYRFSVLHYENCRFQCQIIYLWYFLVTSCTKYYAITHLTLKICISIITQFEMPQGVSAKTPQFCFSKTN